MIDRLPDWNVRNLRPAFNDLESATVLEMMYKLYGKNQELIDDYNKFATEINTKIEAFETSTNKDIECFKAEITKILHDYIAILDEKLKLQDKEIQESIVYIEENITEGVKEVINQMKESGELDEGILNAFNEVDKRVNTLENANSNLSARVDTLENANLSANYNEETKELILTVRKEGA